MIIDKPKCENCKYWEAENDWLGRCKIDDSKRIPSELCDPALFYEPK